MATNIELIGIDRLQKNLSAVQREVFPRAASRTLNTAATRARTLTVRAVAKFMGVKQKVVRDRVVVRKVSPSDIDRGAKIELRGSALNLIHFKARQTKKGVSAAPWGRRSMYRGAFIARIGGTQLVMIRRKVGGRRVHRLPIRPMLGPGIAQSARDDGIREERQRFLAGFIPTELRRQLDLLVDRLPK